MRWDRLFDDLEGQADELAREERDLLADELRDGDWADTSWRQLLGGRVAIEVLGCGRVEGRVDLVNERLVQIAGTRADHVVAASAVVALHHSDRRADEQGRVAAELGWGHVFRAVRDAGEAVVIRLVDGTSREGVIEVVGRDFVRLTTSPGRTQDVVWTAIAMLSGRT